MSQSNSSAELKLGGPLAWLVVLTSALFFFYEFLQMNMFNAINQSLMAAFNLNAAQVSNLSAAYFYADVLLLLPAGIILDRCSTRLVLSIAMAVSITATVCLSLTHDVTIAFIMRALCGFGAAFNLLSSLRLASRWFPESHLALITGVVVTMAMLGGVLAQAPMTYLAGDFGWREALRIDAAIGVVFLLMIIFIVRDFPKGYQKLHIPTHDTHSIRTSLKLVLRNPQNWFAGLYTSLFNLPILVLGALWGIQYLSATEGFSAIESAQIISMLFIGTIIGSPVFGWWSDKINQRKLPMILGGLAAIAIIIAIRYWADPGFMGSLMLFLALGFFTSSQVLSYPFITISNPPELTGTALGFTSILIMGGGAVFQPVMGWLLDLQWNGAMQNGAPLFSMANYHFAFMIFPIMFVIGLVCAFLIKEHK